MRRAVEVRGIHTGERSHKGVVVTGASQVKQRLGRPPQVATIAQARDQDPETQRGRLQIIAVLAEAARDHDLQCWRWEIIRQLC